MLTSYSLAVDIGGTFTDIVLKADDGRLWVDKTLSTHADLTDGFFSGVNSVLGKAGLKPQDVNGLFVHATTTVTNALIERTGKKTALFVTEGFKDVLVDPGRTSLRYLRSSTGIRRTTGSSGSCFRH